MLVKRPIGPPNRKIVEGVQPPKVKEAVNHPAHYHKDSGVEVIDAIEAWSLGFSLGNAVKYIARAAFKGSPAEDLKKARWYLDRAISNVEAGKRP